MTGRSLAGLLLALFPALALGDDPKLPTAAEFDRLVTDALRDVHNRGADLYNTDRDYPGAYRMYQGGLVAVRPLLAHRPEAQKLIADGLLAAEQAPSADRRAFLLHETIEAVRKHLKEGGAAAKPAEPKGKTPESAPMPNPKVKGKESEPAPKKDPAAAAGLSGVVTFKGQPLPAGDVTLVSLDLPKPLVLTAKIGEGGTYAFKEAPPPGRYAVTVTAKAIPEKYQTTTTSGIVVEVKAGANAANLDLK